MLRVPGHALAALLTASIVTLAAAPAAADALHSGERGVVVEGSLDTSQVGDALLGAVGGRWGEIETLGSDRRWLLQWDGLLTFRAGVLGQTHPYTPMVGGHLSGFGEAGYRFEADRAWSLYAGLRLGALLQIMAPWGVGLSDLRTVNSVAGVGGVNLEGLVRAGGGGSWLSDGRSLLLTAFVQESGRIGQPNRPGAAFTDLGLSARFDLTRSLALTAEGWWGTTPTSTDAALGRDDRTTHLVLAGDVRKIFANGMWLGLRSSYAIESDVTTYAASATTYHTTNAPTFDVVLSYGYPLGGPP